MDSVWHFLTLTFFSLLAGLNLIFIAGFNLKRCQVEDLLTKKAKFVLPTIITVFLILTYIEIRPWFLEYILNKSEPLWRITFSSADAFAYINCSNKEEFTLFYLNVYGPCFLLKFLRNSFELVLLFLYGGLGFVQYLFFKEKKNYSWITLFFLLTNPWILVQFTMANKEVFMILTLLSFVVSTYKSKNWVIHILSLIFCFFSKVEFVALYIGFLITRKIPLKLRYGILILIILGLSIFYPQIPGMEEKTHILVKDQVNSKFGFTNFLNQLALEKYLFPLVIIPRIALTIFEKTKGYVFSNNPIEDYISFVIDVGSEWIFFFALLMAFKKRTIFNLRDDRSYLFWLFLIFVATVPFPVFRYILPSYVLLVSFITDRDKKDVSPEIET